MRGIIRLGILGLNWGGPDEITQCCQSSTTNYHETQGDANWLIKDFNWRGSEESFQLSVMKDRKSWHMILEQTRLYTVQQQKSW